MFSSPWATSAVFTNVVGTETVTPRWYFAEEGRLLVVYRHASVGAVNGVVGASIPALTLQDASGSSWVAGLVSKSSPSPAAIVAGMTARSNPTDRYMAAFDAAGVASWASHTATNAMHAFSIELKRTP